MKPVAIIFFADALSAIEVCWSLHDAGFIVKALAKTGKSCPLKTSRFATVKFVTDPEEDFEKCKREIELLLSECDKEDPRSKKVLIPLDDPSLLIANSTNLPSTYRLASPEAHIAQLAIDKWQQIQLAEQAGFDTIPTCIINVNTVLPSVETPCILKPRFAIESQGGQILKREFLNCPSIEVLAESTKRVASESSHIAQPFLKGTGEGVFGFATENDVYILSAHRRVRMMNPEGSGSSACKSTPLEPKLKIAAKKFVQLAKWRGLFMIELLRDNSGTAWFMEFNGRPWGSTALARRQGFEYPAWHALQALNLTLPSIEEQPYIPTICKHIGREIVHLVFVLRGPKKNTNTKWPTLPQTLCALLTPRRRQYWYNFRWSDPIPFFADTFATVFSSLAKKRKAKR